MFITVGVDGGEAQGVKGGLLLGRALKDDDECSKTAADGSTAGRCRWESAPLLDVEIKQFADCVTHLLSSDSVLFDDGFRIEGDRRKQGNDTKNCVSSVEQ